MWWLTSCSMSISLTKAPHLLLNFIYVTELYFVLCPCFTHSLLCLQWYVEDDIDVRLLVWVILVVYRSCLTHNIDIEVWQGNGNCWIFSEVLEKTKCANLRFPEIKMARLSFQLTNIIVWSVKLTFNVPEAPWCLDRGVRMSFIT